MKPFLKRKLRFLPGILAVVALLVLLTMLLWNALMPDVFHLPAINYWQAAGLMLLSRLLLGGLRGFHHHHDHTSRNHLRKRWESLKPEEREEVFRNWDKLHYFWDENRFGDEKDKVSE
jgi:hypothetical protein